jgi:large subunit ribosomal protein L6
MARFSKLPLVIPEGVEITIKDKDISVKGKNGEMSYTLHDLVEVTQKENDLYFKSLTPKVRSTESFVGLAYRLVNNLFIGVTEGFSKVLELNGVGYRMQVSGKVVNLQVGHSHEVKYNLPEGVEAKVDGNKITISGMSKHMVGQVADDIKKYRPVEPYKGKGFRYEGEYVIRKAGKASA